MTRSKRHGVGFPGAVLAAASFGGVSFTAAGAQAVPPVVPDALAPTRDTSSARIRLLRSEERVSLAPASYEARWTAAEAYAEVALNEPDDDVREELLRRGHEHAVAGTELDVEGIDGHYWLAVLAGMLADVTGGRDKVRFGDQVYRESAWVLERDSLHAGAHYLQGRVHAGVMRLNSVTRFLVKLILGGEALDNASWVKAEEHLRRASELRPEVPMHHFELALLYREMRWPDHYERALCSTLAAEMSTPYQDEIKVRARRLLDEIEGP